MPGKLVRERALAGADIAGDCEVFDMLHERKITAPNFWSSPKYAK